MRNFRFSAAALHILLIFPLVLFATNVVYGGPNPPTGDEHLTGPAIVGEMEVFPADGDISVDFIGVCKGQSLTFNDIIFQIDFSSIQGPDDLEGQRITGTGALLPNDCSPKKGGEEVIIHQVTKFERDNIGQVVRANAVILFVVGKGN